MSALAGSHNADVRAEVYRVYPTGWSAARAAGLCVDDRFSVTVERVPGVGWLVKRGVLYYDPAAEQFVEGSWYAATTPARFAHRDLDEALEVARRLANTTTNHRGRTFALIAEDWRRASLEGQTA